MPAVATALEARFDSQMTDTAAADTERAEGLVAHIGMLGA
jgi:hypothetical protein